MIPWIQLVDQNELNNLIDQSHSVPCLIFKHSTRCPISSFALTRVEGQWDFKADDLRPYYLDLIQYRSISNQIAEVFNIPHESPQALLISNGKCVYHSSHLDIAISNIKDALSTTI